MAKNGFSSSIEALDALNSRKQDTDLARSAVEGELRGFSNESTIIKYLDTWDKSDRIEKDIIKNLENFKDFEDLPSSCLKKIQLYLNCMLSQKITQNQYDEIVSDEEKRRRLLKQ